MIAKIIARAMQAASDSGAPLIVAGDFNVHLFIGRPEYLCTTAFVDTLADFGTC